MKLRRASPSSSSRWPTRDSGSRGWGICGRRCCRARSGDSTSPSSPEISVGCRARPPFHRMRGVSERLEKLRAMLEREPNDTFLLYGIAMEHKKLNDAPAALEYLDRVTRIDPG